ncbi:hypothetical protein DFH06DRAFT_1349439 [Mycena polygramma]|nr:hypothetical protein DFH06DRAFT_1349439 [Mycena polygramma]
MTQVLRSAKPSFFFTLLCGLPLELIGLIMVHAILDDPHPLSIARKRSCLCLSSNLLAGVLYRVAPLWDHLVLEFGSRVTVESLNSSIRNSVGRSLRLMIRIWRGKYVSSATRSSSVRAFIHTFFPILQRQFHRFRSVDVTCFDHSGSELILEYMAHSDCRAVENLTMALTLTPNPDVDDLRRPFTSLFPSLHFIFFYRSFLPSCFQTLGCTVTDLRLALIKEDDRVTWEEVWDMLSSFPRLTRLELAGVPCAFFPDVPPPRI